MSEDIKLEDVRLKYSEDPYRQRLEVLRTASLDVRAKQQGGRIAMIAKHMDKVLSRLQKRHNFPAHECVLALDHLVEMYCGTIYETGLELEAKRLLKEEGDKEA